MPPSSTQRKATNNTATLSIDPISQSLLKDLATGTLDVSDWTLSDEQQLLHVRPHLLIVSGVVERLLQGQPKSTNWSAASLFPRICQELESLQDLSSINDKKSTKYTSWTWTPRLVLTPEQQERFHQLVQSKQGEMEELAHKMEQELLEQEKDVVELTKKKKKKKGQATAATQLQEAMEQNKDVASVEETSSESPREQEEVVPPTVKEIEVSTPDQEVQSSPMPWNGVHIKLLSVDAQQETATESTDTTDVTKVILPIIPTTDPSLRIQQLEQALAEKNKALQEQETHWKQKLREAQEQHADVVQALQLRLYIAENKVQTYAQALEQHVQTVGASIFPTTRTTTPLMEGVGGSRVRSRVADGGP